MVRVTRAVGRDLVPTQVQKIVLTPAQIILLNTTSQQVLGVEPGVVPVPLRFHAFKEAGTAYTTGAATGFQLRWGTTVCSHLAHAGFTDQAGATSALGLAPGNSGGLYTSLGQLQTNPGDLNVFVAGGNLSNGTGNIEVTVIYELWPLLRLAGIS